MSGRCLPPFCSLSSISNSTTTQTRSLKVHIMHKKKQPLNKKKRERKKSYFKMEVTSNNTKSKLMMGCVGLQQRLCGFWALFLWVMSFWFLAANWYHAFGLFFFALVFLGLHVGSCGNETVCILDPLLPFGTIEKKRAYVSDVILWRRKNRSDSVIWCKFFLLLYM